MNSFYNIIDKIKEVIVAEPFNNEITFGDIADIDLKKQSLFPLSHVMVNNSTINNNYITFNITIFFMDLVDVSNEQVTDLYRGNDNRQDILNTQLALATRVIDRKSTRLNSSHGYISYAVFCLKKKKQNE